MLRINMNIQRATPVNELLAKLIFLILPTAVVGYFLLINANDYFSILRNQALQQTIYLSAGMGIAALFYAFRFRFLPSFLLLIAGLYIVYKGLDKYAIGEFDSFFISVQFLVFAILFTTGWLIGWGFVRLRYWSVFVSASLLCSCILLIAKANADSVYGLMRAFAPAVLYAVYIIFTAEQIYSYKDKSQKFWWYLSRRLAMFAVLASLLFGGVVYLMRAEIKETVANYGGGAKEGDNSMLKKNKDNSFDLKQYSRLSQSLSRNDNLLFCAHIDNFIPGTEIPNPLYLTAFYYTKFDTSTETFERDSLIPYNDLFEPNPGQMPLFTTKTDSSVIKNSLATRLRKTVDIEVYCKDLSSNTYLAPNVGYFVQPITIEKDFRKEFKSAFRAKSYSSLLNSAYFVYNVPKPDPKRFKGQELANLEALTRFQQQRFDTLRRAGGYEKMDKRFMSYYTYMPSDQKFKQISDLAKQVTDSGKTTVDKVLAIRDYFKARDANGQATYTYTDNPGVPDIPSASKLLYFLFDSHKGYCAYYAGATLFMLRSLGIPSRIAVGFLTENRSDKNPGWYWYYANQAHAWVQVYFPGYGWMDFDTTVGNDEENRNTPKPDGTPPMQPPKAWLATEGVVEDIDTAKRIMKLKVQQMVFHDKEYKLDKAVTIIMDLKIATVRIDSNEVPMYNIHKGDSATAVSYAEVMKKLEPADNESGEHLINRFANPAPIDEVYLKRKDKLKKEDTPPATKKDKPTDWRKMLWTGVGIVAGLLLLFLLVPVFILAYYKLRHKNAKANGNKAYWAYRTAGFYLNQIGVYRGTNTPMQYALKIVDPQFGTSFGAFMNVYLKQKYAKQPLTPSEQDVANTFLKKFLATVSAKTPFKKRFFSFLNPLRSINYFVIPDDEKDV